jgi:hypothetical protein
MSTRTNIHFNQWGETQANIYRHSDGYPEGVLPDLRAFFERVSLLSDARFGHAEYLAAKFLVWQAQRYAVDYEWDKNSNPTTIPKNNRLDFLSVAPCVRDHGDIEFIYEIDCDRRVGDTGFPRVRYRACYGDDTWIEAKV